MAHRGAGSRKGWFARHPAWPITALLAGYPLWWALGVGDYMFVLLAIPMAAALYAWRRRGSRRIRLPPGFGMWLMFLVVMLAGAAMLTLTAPHTVRSPVSHRVLSFANRTADYGGVTVLLLYAGNLTERELSRRRLAWLLGLLAVYTAAGGVAGMLDPSFQFNSPALMALPHSVQSNSFIQASMHPGFAQVENVIGVTQGRPKAPFDYTNTWGNCLSLLLPWLIVGWWTYGTRRQRMITVAVLAASVAPLVYSLDRGVWIGLGFAICYMAVRMAARGKLLLLGTTCAAIVLAAIVVLASPLHNVISQRMSHGHSNAIRTSLSSVAISDGLSSPVIGYGDTRQERGSPHSIAIGPTASCRQCGQYAVGSNGQLWM
ncbi:MAG: O-antigen ligase family protein, partial [Micromonosporaceae bacterium]